MMISVSHGVQLPHVIMRKFSEDNTSCIALLCHLLLVAGLGERFSIA